MSKDVINGPEGKEDEAETTRIQTTLKNMGIKITASSQTVQWLMDQTASLGKQWIYLERHNTESHSTEI